MIYSPKTPIQKYLETIEEIENPPTKEEFAKTGFPQMDKVITGYRKGKLTILIGDHGISVTSFILNSMLQLESSGINNAVFYSADQSIDIILRKLISIKTKVYYDTIMKNRLEHYEIDMVRKEIHQLENLINNIDGSMYQSTYRIKQNVIKYKEKPHIIFIDSIQSLIFEQDVYAVSSDECSQTNETIDALIKIAKELNIAIVAVSKIPIKHGFDFGHNMNYLEYFRKRRTYEEDAHEIMALYRPEFYKIDTDDFGKSTQGQAYLSLLKNVTGKEPYIVFQFIDKYKKFT